MEGGRDAGVEQVSEEFKRQAASLVIDGGRSVRDVARELGVDQETLRNRVAPMRKERAAPGGPVTPDERAELVRLRRKVAKHAPTRL